MIKAEAPPPPLHIPATPILPLFCFSTLINVITILLPLEPRGCPRATAPPLTSTLLGSILSSFVLTIPTTEKA